MMHGSSELPITVDLHVDTISRLVVEAGDDLVKRQWRGARPDLAVDLPRCLEGNVRVLCCACFVPDDDPTPRAHALAMLDRIAEFEADPTLPVRVIRHPLDIPLVDEAGIGIIPTIENARSLEGDLDTIDRFAERGVAFLGVTWNGANDLATGCRVADDGGLTEFGREAITRAADRAMAIDISHLNRAGVDEVFAMRVPILATHSNCRALHDHPRNLDDAQLEALAAADGLLGLNLYPPFLGEGEVDLATFAAHARHAADRIGADRLALGSDLDGIDETAGGFRDHRDLPALRAALEAVGFSSDEAAGLCGENFIRWWTRVRPTR